MKNRSGNSLILLFLLHVLSVSTQVLPDYTCTALPGRPGGYYLMCVFKPPLKIQWESPVVWNIIMDGDGEIVYYRKFFKDEKVVNFQILPNGKFSYYYQNKFLLMDSTFAVVDSVYCRNNLATDHHEILSRGNGNYVLLGTETFTSDLSPYKVFNHLQIAGSPTAQVIAGTIQEIDKNGHITFEWHARDHFRFMDVDTFFLSDHTKVDWTHFNSLAFADNGDLILSIRHFNEITRIEQKSGKVLWRMGGKNNQFKFMNDKDGFIGQHDARLSAGKLSVFDNGRPDSGFHALSVKEYRLDEKKMTATLVFRQKTDSTHSVKGLGNFMRIGHSVLINYGNNAKFPETFSVHDAKGKELFNVRFSDTLRSYRVYYYDHLPFSIRRPLITERKENGRVFLVAEPGHRNYLWNNGQTGQEIEVTEPGNYKVWVSAATGFVSSETKEIRKTNNKAQ